MTKVVHVMRRPNLNLNVVHLHVDFASTIYWMANLTFTEIMIASRAEGETRQSSPIFKLNYDTLLTIFMLNCCIFDVLEVDAQDLSYIQIAHEAPSALLECRSLSQVCGLWRRIMINSPSPWANCLNSTLLNQKTSHWREEVLRRTGDAPLTVIAMQNGGHREKVSADRHTEFLSPLVEIHWNRIRRLFVEVEDGQHDLVEVLNAAVLRPAPFLEICAIVYSGGAGGRFPNPSMGYSAVKRMFSPDHAPQLRSLRFDTIELGTSHSSQSMRGLSSIRHLHMSTNFPSVSVLLDRLQAMSSLETLHISHERIAHDSLQTPLVVLPRLKDIHIYHQTSEVVTNIVTHLFPSAGCKLRVKAISSVETSAAVLGLYHSLTKKHCNIDDVTDIHFSVDRYYRGTLFDHFSLRARGASLSETNSLELESTLFHWDSVDRNEDNLVYMMARSLALCNLGDVESLTLKIERNRHNVSNTDIHDFLAALYSVKNLHTDLKTLNFLVCAQARTSLVLLPNLVNLKLRNNKGACENDSLTGFILRRREMGKALERLVLPSSNLTQTTLSCMKMMFFKAIEGLSVEWEGLEEEVDK